MSLGSLHHLWTNGFNGQKVYFVDDHNIIYTCDTTIRHFNTQKNESRIFKPFDSDVFNLLTASATHHKIAFSNTLVPPTVFIHDSNNFKEVSKLTKGAKIEFISIEFSNGEAILTLSGIPDLEIIIWNWMNGEQITKINLEHSLIIPKQVYFSPTNWRNIIVGYDKQINIFKIEQFEINCKTTKTQLPMPSTTGEYKISKNVKKDDEFSPNSVIAAVKEELTDSLEETLDRSEKQNFKYACCNSDDELYVLTNNNSIYKYTLNDKSYPVFIYKLTNNNEKESNKDVALMNNDTKTSFPIIKQIQMHKQGLVLTLDDGTIQLLDVTSFDTSDPQIRKTINIGTPYISNLSFNETYSFLSISSNKGIYLYDFQSERLIKQNIMSIKQFEQTDTTNNNLLHLVNDNIVGIANVNPLTDTFLSLKNSGTLQVWNLNQSLIINKMFLNVECTVLASHPHMPLVVVGTGSGHLIFIDCSNYKAQLRVVDKCRLHNKSVEKLKFNTSGTLLFSIGADGKMYVIDTRLTDKIKQIIVNDDQRLVNNFSKNKVETFKSEKAFYVLGYIEFDGEVVSFDTFDFYSETVNTITTRVGLSLYDSNSQELMKKSPNESNNINLNSQNGTTNPVVNARDQSIINTEYNSLVYYKVKENGRKLASKIIILELNYDLFTDKNKLYNNLHKLEFKDEAINKQIFYTPYLFSDFSFLSRVYLNTFVGRFTCKFLIPEVDLTKKASKLSYLQFLEIVSTHELPYGRLLRTLNDQFVISAGFDGLLLIRKLNDLSKESQIKGHNYLNGGFNYINYTYNYSNFISVGYDMTIMAIEWKHTDSEQLRDIEKAPIKGDFDNTELRNLPSLYAMSINNAEQSDITWLEAREMDYFKLEDEKLTPIKKEIVNGLNEIKLKLQELMKTNRLREDIAKLEESEFYLDLEELERLHKDADAEIQSIRESKDYENTAKLYTREIIKRDCWDKMKVKGRGIESFSGNIFIENYPLKERSKAELKLLDRIKFIRKIELAEKKSRKEILADVLQKEKTFMAELDEDDQKDQDNINQNGNNSQSSQSLTQLALKGSVGSLFDGDSPYFYNQFELHTCEQKWIQIVLLQDAIFRIKENFNKEFDQVMQRKLQEIGKVKEKNQRIKQIYSDLNEEKPLKEQIFSDLENPEMLFEVKDEEIKVEKYLTPEQKRLLEEQLAEEERRKQLEKLDNWRDRGLMEMMGGVLQIRREDELKKDIPVPDFVTEKPQDEWTQDEVKQFQIYEQKVKELNEEREKLRKQLNGELNKLTEQIQECYQNFDNALLALHHRKVKTQQAVYQEELKIERLLHTLIANLELERYENQLSKRLDKLKENKKELSQEIIQMKKYSEKYKEEVETLSFEDKHQEKAFQREFSDVPSSLREQLLKLFRKRPKLRISTVTKSNLSRAKQFISDLGAENPYAERPSTAQQLNIQKVDLDKGLLELDNPNNAPIGIDQSVWDRFVIARRQKIEMENKVKWKSMIWSEMNDYITRRDEEENQLKRDIEDTQKLLNSVQDMKIHKNHNLDVQLIVKQGQVETNPGADVHNFKSCLLLNRTVINALNKVIQAHGKQKISIMVECKDFKKGIRQLEWENKKRQMQIEDAKQKSKDITYLKLTREVQEFLNSEDYDAKKQKEISVLEETLAYQNQQYQKKYGEQNGKFKNVRNESIKIANNNNHFDEKLKETNVLLNEKKHIEYDLSSKNVERAREERFREIIQRRKLVDLAKTQAQEVAFLRSEVERLRMKTFPALVQIEF